MLCSSCLFRTYLLMLSIGNIEAQTIFINMKIFRSIGIALVAILISVNFIAYNNFKKNYEAILKEKCLYINHIRGFIITTNEFIML